MNELDQQDSDHIICYLTCPKEKNDFTGAVLLTDTMARPLHFAHVSPVRPTAMQRILYGDTLNEHVKVEVIAKQLLQSIPKRPSVVFVDTPDLLPVRRVAGVPVAYLSRNGTSGDEQGVRYATQSSSEDKDAVGTLVEKLDSRIDFAEPFKRLQDALKETGKATGG